MAVAVKESPVAARSRPAPNAPAAPPQAVPPPAAPAGARGLEWILMLVSLCCVALLFFLGLKDFLLWLFRFQP
jgi:hypothetical protein